MNTLLSIDPGARIGWCIFQDGIEYGRGVLDFTLFSHSLKYHSRRIEFTPRMGTRTSNKGPGWFQSNQPIKVDEVVYESYYQDPGVKSGGSTGPAQEVIGVVKYVCIQAGIEPVRQRSAILPVAKAHTGYIQQTVHLPDQDSAWLHGSYYLNERGIIDLSKRPGGVSATL